MTELQQKALQRCLDWCAAGQKAHAWKLAKDLALLDPHQLSEMPDLLTNAMRQLQDSKPSENGTKRRES